MVVPLQFHLVFEFVVGFQKLSGGVQTLHECMVPVVPRSCFVVCATVSIRAVDLEASLHLVAVLVGPQLEIHILQRWALVLSSRCSACRAASGQVSEALADGPFQTSAVLVL